MAIRVEHNYGGAAIGGAYVAGRGRAQERQKKYALDLMQKQQDLAQRRQEIFQDRLFRYGMAQQGQQFQLNRDAAQQEFSAAQRELDRQSYAERDKARMDAYAARDREERIYSSDRDAAARDREDIASGRYSPEDATWLREVEDKIRSIQNSDRISDPAKKQQMLDEWRAKLAEVRGRKMDVPSLEDRFAGSTIEKNGRLYQYNKNKDSWDELSDLTDKSGAEAKAAKEKAARDQLALENKEEERLKKLKTDPNNSDATLAGMSESQIREQARKNVAEKQARDAERLQTLIGGEVAGTQAAPRGGDPTRRELLQTLPATADSVAPGAGAIPGDSSTETAPESPSAVQKAKPTFDAWRNAKTPEDKKKAFNKLPPKLQQEIRDLENINGFVIDLGM